MPTKPLALLMKVAGPGPNAGTDMTDMVIRTMTIQTAAAVMARGLNRPVEDLAGMLQSEIAALLSEGHSFTAALEQAKQIVAGRISAGLA